MPKLKLPTHDTIVIGNRSVELPRHYAPGDVLNAASSSLLNDHMLARFRNFLASKERSENRALTAAEILDFWKREKL